VPPADSDLVFGNRPSGNSAQTVQSLPNNIRSLWIQGHRDYTLAVGSSINLGSGLADNGHLITVLAEANTTARQHTIQGKLTLAAGSKTFEIGNYNPYATLRFTELGSWGSGIDAGGNSLRFVSLGVVNVGGPLSNLANLTITGAGKTTFGETLTWTGTLAVTDSNVFLHRGIAGAGSVTTSGAADAPYSVLYVSSAPTSEVYTGDITIGGNSLVIAGGRGSGTLGKSNTVEVQDGGSLVARGSIGGYYSSTPFSIILSGEGVGRQEGTFAVGAFYGDGSGSTEVAMTLAADASVGVRSGRGDQVTFQKEVSESGGSYALTKVGSGLLVLEDSSNYWSGGTVLKKGALRVTPAALPSANIRFDGGLLEIKGESLTTPITFSRDLGTGDDEVQWLGGGGFSATNTSALTVTLSGDAMLTWGAGGFVADGQAFLLNSRYSNAAIIFTNAIDLGSAQRELRVERGTQNSFSAWINGQWVTTYTDGYAKLSGPLIGMTGGGIVKTGAGLLWLASSNAYTGATLIRDGALRGGASSLSNTQFDAAVSSLHGSGVIGLDDNYLRSLGTGANQVQWLRSGGFAAYGAKRTVKLGNSTDAISWGDPNFVQSGQELRFGHYTADAAVIWDRELNFGDEMRTIRVERGNRGGSSPNLVDVVFNQALSNDTASGGLRLVGDGRAELVVNNSDLNGDSLEISGAALRLSAQGRLGPVANIDLSNGGRLEIMNSSTAALVVRLP